jgi:hypothetical protein
MSQSVILTREPVINRNRTITANRLITHGPSVGAIMDALHELEEVWPSYHTVFICLGRLVPNEECLKWPLPENALFEIPAQTLGQPCTRNLMDALRAQGVGACLSWFSSEIRCSEDDFWRFALIDARKHPFPENPSGLSLAWGLDSSYAFDEAVHNGYDGASGAFFLSGKPTGRQVAPSHSQIIRLINLLRNNADIREIELLLKQDVALSYKLLRYINTAGFSLSCEIQSFRHAVSILGYNNLNKWLSLLLVTASRDPCAPAMMQTAITRGAFMEAVGTPFLGSAERDNLFITGAFSLLHLLLGTSMDALLDEMYLPPHVSEALLRDTGELSPFLRLARACESFDARPLRQMAEHLHLEPALINRALLSAVGFADSLQA